MIGPGPKELAAACAKIPRVYRPRAPEHLPADLRPVWRKVAPQVCAWSPVTVLDMDALADLIGTAHDTQQQTAFVATLPAKVRRKWYHARRRRRAFLWELCQAFLLGPEVLEEITMPDGAPLADLLKGKHGRRAGAGDGRRR